MEVLESGMEPAAKRVVLDVVIDNNYISVHDRVSRSQSSRVGVSQ